MAKIDHGKFADKLLIAIGKKPEPKAGPKEPAEAEEDDKEENEPGKLGRIAGNALKHQDWEAFEEAIGNICAKYSE